MSKAKNTHCLYCGEPLPRGCSKYCTEKCGILYRKSGGTSAPPKPKRKTLERWALEARECNLDYGTYRRLIESGKTYAELRARAKDHGLQPHATRGHWLSGN